MKTETENLRELDAWIAINIMGWRRCSNDGEGNYKDCVDGIFWRQPDGSAYRSSCPPHYTTDPAAAMLVLEKCIENGYTPLLSRAFHSNEQRDLFSCRNGDMGDEYASAETLPLAICKFTKKLFSK